LSVAAVGDGSVDPRGRAAAQVEVAMTEKPGEADRPLHDPEPSLGGPDVAAAVRNAEAGSEAEGTHGPAEPGADGDSRLEQMREVEPD
jgi:hypothetical protein